MNNKLIDRDSEGQPPDWPPDAAGYEADVVAWVERQTDLLRDGHFDELDRENLLEELESMGSNVHHDLRSRLIVIPIHLLKCKYQPQRKCKSWFATISEQRDQIALHLQRSTRVPGNGSAEIGIPSNSAVLVGRSAGSRVHSLT